MNILILGGTGAMGKPLVDILLDKAPESFITVTSRFHHNSDNVHLKYIIGNARDNDFLSGLISDNRFDVIVDFMNYDLEEFRQRLDLLLGATSHYIWFSSCRVYADSYERLTEESSRLLEKSNDGEFLATNRYALRKARQEDLLHESGKSNYTIIRPYITYNTERLQLGILEKEHWLYRLLHGKSLVVSETMLDKKTTLTNGIDVSGAVADIIIADSPKGEVFQIAGSETMTWRDILALYGETLSREAGITPVVYSSDKIEAIEKLWEGGYNTIYDRNYNRSFDSSKINEAIGHPIAYTSISKGLASCLTDFLKSERKFLHIIPEYEAYQDLLCDETSNQDYFDSKTDYEIYMHERGRKIDDISGLENIKRRVL